MSPSIDTPSGNPETLRTWGVVIQLLTGSFKLEGNVKTCGESLKEVFFG
jgi:hypothetical protein